MNRKLLVLAMLMFAALSLVPPAVAADKAVIAIAAEEGSAASQISKTAARSSYFLFFDEKGGLVEAAANPHRHAAGSAGPQVVDFLAAKGVRTVIAGEFGAKMKDAMNRQGMVFRKVSGSAADAVKSAVKR